MELYGISMELNEIQWSSMKYHEVSMKVFTFSQEIPWV